MRDGTWRAVSLFLWGGLSRSDPAGDMSSIRIFSMLSAELGLVIDMCFQLSEQERYTRYRYLGKVWY